MTAQVLLGAQRTLKACQPFLHIENNNRNTSQRVLDLVVRQLGFDCFWDVMRYEDVENYYGRPLPTVLELLRESKPLFLSINIMCVPLARFPQGIDDPGLPETFRRTALALTRLDPDRPLLDQYAPEGIGVPEWLVSEVQFALEDPSAPPTDGDTGTLIRVIPRHSVQQTLLQHSGE